MEVKILKYGKIKELEREQSKSILDWIEWEEIVSCPYIVADKFMLDSE